MPLTLKQSDKESKLYLNITHQIHSFNPLQCTIYAKSSLIQTHFGYKHKVSCYFVWMHIAIVVYIVLYVAAATQHRIIQHNAWLDSIPSNTQFDIAYHMRPDMLVLVFCYFLLPSHPYGMYSNASKSETTVRHTHCKHKNKNVYWPTVNCQTIVVDGTHFSLSVTFAETSWIKEIHRLSR